MPLLLFIFLLIVLPIGGMIFIITRPHDDLITRRQYGMAITMTILISLYSLLLFSYLAVMGYRQYAPTYTLGMLIGYLPLEVYVLTFLQIFLVSLVVWWLWKKLYPDDLS